LTTSPLMTDWCTQVFCHRCWLRFPWLHSGPHEQGVHRQLTAAITQQPLESWLRERAYSTSCRARDSKEALSTCLG